MATLALVLVLVWMRWSPPPDEDVDGAWRGLLLANATGVRLALHFHVALNDDALSLRRAAACVHDADVALRDAHEDDGIACAGSSVVARLVVESALPDHVGHELETLRLFRVRVPSRRVRGPGAGAGAPEEAVPELTALAYVPLGQGDEGKCPHERV